MKSLTLIFALIIFTHLPGYSQSVPLSEAEVKAGKEVLETVARWGDAVKNNDTKMLDILFRDDLVITTFDGRVRGKSEELEILKPSENVRTTAVTNDNLVVRVYGNTAIVTGIAKMEFLASGKTSQAAFRYTAVFVKENKGWQLAALHTSNGRGTPANARTEGRQ